MRNKLPIATERAISFLRRAATLAAHAGAYSEAQTYLQSAVSIAPESELVSLYEQMGDDQLGEISSVESYQKALEYWHNLETHSPLIGARLLRKLLVGYTRWAMYEWFGTEHLLSWRTEAQQLAEQAGDEDELWRIRVADLFITVIMGQIVNLTSEKREALKQLGLDAAAYFEQKEDWTSFSEVLDGYSYFCQLIGDPTTFLEASKRRLAIADLPAREYGDALQMVARGYYHLNDCDNCIETVKQALKHLRPGQPVIHLASAISAAIDVVTSCGHWSDIDTFIPVLEEAREQSRYDQKAGFVVFNGYMNLLSIALAREDQTMINTITSVLLGILAGTPQNEFASDVRTYITALLSDSIQEIILAASSITSRNLAPTVIAL